MSIDRELKLISSKKHGNCEMALFFEPDPDEGGEWEFHLGNPSEFVQLGESYGDFVVSGHTLEVIISKMKRKIKKEKKQVIRFIDLRGQSTGHNFAWFDTMRDIFSSFNGEVAFDTWDDFCMKCAFINIERYKALCPEWVFKKEK